MTDAEAGFEAPASDPANPPAATETPPAVAIANDAAPTAGALLTRAREAAGLTRSDVAGKLKFGVKQIEAVESDKYAALGGKTFVRGLVRTYAKLLEVDPGPVLAALERSELPPETGQVAADPKGVPFPGNRPPPSPVLRSAAISMGVIALMILLLYLWHGEEFLGGPSLTLPVVKTQPRSSATAAPTAINVSPTVMDNPPRATAVAPSSAMAVAPSSATAVAASSAAAVASPASAPASTPNATPSPPPKSAPASAPPPVFAAERVSAAANPPVSPAPVIERKSTVASAAPAAAPATNPLANLRTGNGRRILMSFDRNSWVEVKDASGRIVFSQLNLAGTQQVIEGRAPFELVIGNAGYVNLHYRDEPVDLKPYTKSDVARVTLK
jgi:cytoskeleton protein RodZ